MAADATEDEPATPTARFLETLAATGNVTAAARAARLGRRAVYHLRERDEDFAAAWADAAAEAWDALEAEARRRAVDGVEIRVIHGGKVVCDENGVAVTIRHYSDRLLEFLLKARSPERETGAVADEVRDGGTARGSGKLTVEEALRRVDQLARRARARQARRDPDE